MKEIWTALITPFDQDNQIDWKALENIVQMQIEEGVDGFIVCGTTAEIPTLSMEEQEQIIEKVLSITKGRVKVYAGAGTNNTATTLANIARFEKYPLDGYLIVTPYYNRPSEDGLYAHFVAASAMTRKNILLYHVPSRTGSAITIRLFERLVMKCHNITGMKYAAQDYMTLAKLKKLFPSLYFYSGDDVTCFDAIAAGADGVISVMSHMLLPEMKTAILTKNQPMQHELEFFAKYCFLETSPSPIKYMLSQAHLCNNILRLPLCTITKDTQHILDQEARTCYDKLRLKKKIT